MECKILNKDYIITSSVVVIPKATVYLIES